MLLLVVGVLYGCERSWNTIGKFPDSRAHATIELQEQESYGAPSQGYYRVILIKDSSGQTVFYVKTNWEPVVRWTSTNEVEVVLCSSTIFFPQSVRGQSASTIREFRTSNIGFTVRSLTYDVQTGKCVI
jgi:hypothetical protein